MARASRERGTAAAWLASGAWMAAGAWTLFFGAAGATAQISNGNGGSSTAREVTATDGLIALTTTGAVRVDGVLDEADWTRAQVAGHFVQQVPEQGSAASEATEVRLMVDAGALYVGARLSDAEPDGVVARLARRDVSVHADWFYVYVDSYDDDRTAFGFGVSAAGVQRDLRISGDTRQDASWDAVWASSVAIDEAGWTVEMRIPLTQLRFNASGSDARWGVNFLRQIARKNETAHWAAVPQGTDRFVSLFAELTGVGTLEGGRRVEVIPYSVSRLTRAPGSTDDPYYSANDFFGTVGGDVHVGLGSSLTLSATFNPDFGQVEADPATVNLTAFETFFSERRPFFVEGSDIFRLTLPSWPPFFYSRRIGRSPQGFTPSEARYRDRPTATTIHGAVKLSGRTDGGWSIGLLNAVTGAEHVKFVDAANVEGSALVEPRTNYSVARVAKELRGGESGIGVMATSGFRDLEGAALDYLHDRALGGAIDGFHRFASGAYTAEASLLFSHVRGSTTALSRTQQAAGHYYQRPDADHVTFDPDRESLSGTSFTARVQKARGAWKWGLHGQATSPGYEVSDLGFNPTLDHTQGNAWLSYNEYQPGPLFRDWNVRAGSMIQRSWNGEQKELTADLGFNFRLLNYWGGGVWVMRHRPAWSTIALRGGPALRRPGRWMGTVQAGSDPRKKVWGNAFVFWEREDDTGRFALNASSNVVFRPSDQLEVRLGPSFNRGGSAWQYLGRRIIDDGPVWFMGNIERRTVSLSTRVDYTVSPRASFQLYLRPFLASGQYTAVREVVDPRSPEFDTRFRTYVQPGGPVDGAFQVDRDGDGATDLELRDPSFNVASLQLNAVFRWEYRPGSTLFAVWTHDRSAFGQDDLRLRHDLDRLLEEPARNVFMVKVSYWLGL